MRKIFSAANSAIHDVFFFRWEKKIIIMLFIGCSFLDLIFVSCTTNLTATDNKIMLSRQWYLQSSDKIDKSGKELSTSGIDSQNWYPVEVPSTVLAALVENGVYPDPYFGDNLKSIPGYREGRWLAMSPGSPFYKSWWYRTEFQIPEAWIHKKKKLHFDGINYKVNVWLNGELIADTANVVGMFKRFTFDIDGIVKTGQRNILAVEVFAPGRIPDIRYGTKQIEATTGWDDHNPQPPDLNMGLWEDVYLSASGPVTIQHPYVVTDLDLPSLDTAVLTISAELENKASKPVKGTLVGKIENITFKTSVELGAGEKRTVVFDPREHEQLSINSPRLWWPHPAGPQELYNLELSFLVDGEESSRKNVRFGIREVSTYVDDEGWRGYQVNGKNLLIRGGAWMTSDMMLNLTEDRYDALVRYAREANLNALRSEGFSIRETEEFYNKCDEYGILVIQQIFGRSIPDEALAVDLIKDMILRIRNHPSLIHFLGHDETFPTENLDKAYRELIARYTPQRTYQPHSGAFHVEDRYQTGGTRTGTLELWTYATPSHYYKHKEDGAWGFAQSGGIGGIIAPYESIRRMMPESAQWPVRNEIFSFHTVLQGIEYFDLAITSLNQRYGEPSGIEEFCRKGQAMNYESARGMYEAYGRNKYDALGITTWKYNAAWPAAMTWQYVDWYLNVGGAYYGAKKACEPLHVQYAYDDNAVYVLNSYYQKFENLTVSARLFNWDMTEKFARSKIINIGPDDIEKCFVVNFPEDISTTHFLSLQLKNQEGQELSNNLYWLSTIEDRQGSKDEFHTDKGWGILKAKPASYADFKALNNLPKARLNTSTEIIPKNSEYEVLVTLENPADMLAFQINLAVKRTDTNSEILPAYWEDNYFSLLPGEKREVKAKFSQEGLTSDKIELSITGWNIE